MGMHMKSKSRTTTKKSGSSSGWGWNIHPGEILREEFLKPMGISAYRLARSLHLSRSRVNDIVLERRAITADTALRLGRFFGTTPQLWTNLQASFDLRKAENALGSSLKRIVPARPKAA
jgi:addiction module HigA family antidote